MKTATKLLMAVLATIFLVSCGGEKIEREAKKAMGTHFKEVAKVPNSVKLSNAEVMFSDDSLCIIHVDFTAKNTYGVELTNREEYIYLKSSHLIDGKYDESIWWEYEMSHSIEKEDDMIYCSEWKYDLNKIGEIYKGLNYPQGLYFLATKAINSSGNRVGSKDKRANVPLVTGTGEWELSHGVLSLFGEGKFSNSVTVDSELLAELIVGEDNLVALKLFEYNKYPVSDEGFAYFYMGCTGNPEQDKTYEFRMYVGENLIIFTSDKDRDEFRQLLSYGGQLVVRTSIGKYTKSEYSFHFDISGYDKALEILQTQ